MHPRTTARGQNHRLSDQNCDLLLLRHTGGAGADGRRASRIGLFKLWCAIAQPQNAAKVPDGHRIQIGQSRAKPHAPKCPPHVQTDKAPEAEKEKAQTQIIALGGYVRRRVRSDRGYFRLIRWGGPARGKSPTFLRIRSQVCDRLFYVAKMILCLVQNHRSGTPVGCNCPSFRT